MAGERVRGGGPVEALCLMSGGLDSQLAVCVLRAQGIGVTGLAFHSPFFDVAAPARAAEALRIPLVTLDFTPDLLPLLRSPPHGFGSGMNPCIDCHAAMLRRAGEYMTGHGMAFLATGEVLNERPFSQTRDALRIVARESGYEEWIVRPLSARLLPETQAEKMGLVDRSRLLALEGRGRKRQIALAAEFGIVEYPAPAGGCKLTEPNYARRLRDLATHEGLADVRAFELLKLGRHVRLSPTMKIVVGRDEADNARIEGLAELYDLLIRTESVPGPVVLAPGHATEAEIAQAAAVCARYCDVQPGQPVRFVVRSPAGTRTMDAVPASQADVEKMLV